MIKKLLLTAALTLAITPAFAQEATPEQLGAVPGAKQYSLVKMTDKCIAGTAFSIGGSDSLATIFAIVREVNKGNSIFLLDPRLAGLAQGELVGKIIWIMQDGSKQTVDAKFTTHGNEDLTYYFTQESAALFQKATAVGFHVGNFLQGFNLNGALQAAVAANQCATK